MFYWFNATTRPPFYSRSIFGKFDDSGTNCSLGPILGHELLGIPYHNHYDDGRILPASRDDPEGLVVALF
jgi:hypothetical protein